MSTKEIADCAKCGSFASQAMNVETTKRGLITSRAYYIHCFDGDCGAEGPTRPTSDESIFAWNELQARASFCERVSE